MKKIMSTNYPAWAFNVAMLLLRVVFGVSIVPGGYQKLTHFNEYKTQFMNFMGLGPSVSLALVIFAEFFCSLLLIAGLFTRLAAIPLIITMCVVVFKVFHGDIFDKATVPFFYLAAFLTILLCGPGKVSVDGMTK